MWLLQLPLILGDQTVSPEFVSDLFFNFLKVLFILVGILYTVFAIVVIRQIHTMQRTLVTSLSGSLKVVGYVHVGLAILAVIFFVTIL